MNCNVPVEPLERCGEQRRVIQDIAANHKVSRGDVVPS